MADLEHSIEMKEKSSTEDQANLFASQREYKDLRAAVVVHIQGRGKEVVDDAPNITLIQLLQVT